MQRYNTNNWQDVYENTFSSGFGQSWPIIDVYYRDGKPHAIFYEARGEYVNYNVSRLVPKKKKPAYRPYKNGEVKFCDIFASKNNKSSFMVTGIAANGVSLSGSYFTFEELLSAFTKSDGSPAGILAE